MKALIEEPKKIVFKISYCVFLLIYCLSASEWELPASSLLRWVGMGIMAFFGTVDLLKWVALSIKNKAQHGPIEKYKTIREKRERIIYAWPFNFLVLVYVIGCFVSDDNFGTGVKRAISFFLLIYALYSYFQRQKTTSKDMMSYFRIFGIALCLLMYAMVLYYVAFGGSIGDFKGIYANKNYLVSISCTAVCTGVFLVLETRNILKVAAIGGLVCATFVTIATGSRAGIICMALAYLAVPFITMEAKSFGQKLKIIIGLAAVVIVFLIVAKRSDIPALERMLAGDSANGATGLSRGNTWALANDLIVRRPWLGWGNSAAYYNTFVAPRYGWGVHSSYLMILVDHGIIGAILHGLFMLFFAFRNLKRYFSADLSNKERRFVKILSVTCLMLLVNAAAESFLFAVGNIASVSFWLPLVILDVFLYMKRREKNADAGKDNKKA